MKKQTLLITLLFLPFLIIGLAASFALYFDYGKPIGIVTGIIVIPAIIYHTINAVKLVKLRTLQYNEKRISIFETQLKLDKLKQRIKLIETQLELDEIENTQEFVQELFKEIEKKKKEQALLIKNKTNPTRRKG